MKKLIEEWRRIKFMLDDIQPENKCYSRVKALIRAGSALESELIRVEDKQ